MKKPRSDNKLLNLPEEQQAKLAEWLLSGVPYWQAKELCEKEFAVSASPSAFSGFWAAVCGPALLARRRRAANMANEFAQEAENSPAGFDAATIAAIKQKAFEISISPNANPKDVKAILMMVLKANDQELARKKLEFELQKYKDTCQAASDQVRKLREKGSGLNETERTAILDKVDEILGIK